MEWIDGELVYSMLSPSVQEVLWYGSILLVMCLTALTFTGEKIVDGEFSGGGTILSVVMSLGLLPLAAFSIWWSIMNPWDLDDSMAMDYERLFRSGFLVAAVTPCAFVSASFWIRKAGGNDGTSHFVAFITHLLCIVVAPLWLFFFGVADDAFSRFPGPFEIAEKIGLFVVLPFVLVLAARGFSGKLNEWASDHKKSLSVAAQCGLLAVVFLAGRSIFWVPSVFFALMVIAAVFVLHFSVFWIGLGTGRALGLEREDYIAVGFAGSQKTLIVGLLICWELRLPMFPVVFYYICQLLRGWTLPGKPGGMRARLKSWNSAFFENTLFGVPIGTLLAILIVLVIVLLFILSGIMMRQQGIEMQEDALRSLRGY
jgi:predicted Na+-dependent transporter